MFMNKRILIALLSIFLFPPSIIKLAINSTEI